ncbi:MAG: type II toxin-antitoxin system Phd/YefM family antitoxin [Acidimicrobiales bacterium]
MTRIGVRELRQHASRYLDKVRSGEVVEITDRGKLVALLISPEPAATAREHLIASGRLTPARSVFQLPVRRRVDEGDRSATELLSELREDR